MDHPYLNDKSKLALIQKTGLDGKKISNWFMNVRKRIWQPVMKRGKNKSKWSLKIFADLIMFYRHQGANAQSEIQAG